MWRRHSAGDAATSRSRHRRPAAGRPYPSDLVNAPEPLNDADLEPTLEVGVGPWVGAELPTDPHFDPVLLAHGDRRNVVDRYRYWSRDAIVADLDKRRHDFHVAIENWQHDFNIGTVVRNANAFLAREVHIVGRRRWNRRGAMVTDRYQHVRHHHDINEFVAWARSEGLTIVGLDNVDGSVPLETTPLPRHCVMLFGQEGPGLSDAALAACDQLFSIAQFGSTRSINAGVASGIAMHAWIRSYVIADSDSAALDAPPT
jgi:tRNA(Leu) C34 or U34 (ribose-2'-O)-methylase TrmL